MATKKTPISWQTALRDDILTQMAIELGPDIKELFETHRNDERAGAVVEHVQRYVSRKSRNFISDEFDGSHLDVVEMKQKVANGILQRYVPGFISDKHREFFVRCHARGLSTSEAFMELIPEDETIQRFIQHDAVGLGPLKSILVTRLAYLKLGSTRWPEKKYGAIWRDERERYKKEVDDIPFTSPTEQAALLSKHAGRIDGVLEHKEHSAADWQLLTNSLVKTLDSLRKVSTVEQQGPTNLSGTQLIGVLERLTLALDAPDQLAPGTDTDALVGVLERLTVALKSPDHGAVADQVKAIPTNTNADDDSSA